MNSRDNATERIVQCRLCCAYGIHTMDIIDDKSNDLFAKIFTCFGIQVNKRDKSTKICHDCFKEVNAYFRFHQVCAFADVRMRYSPPANINRDAQSISAELEDSPNDIVLVTCVTETDTTYNVLPAPQSIETRACSVVLNRIKLEPTEIEKLSEQCDIEASDQQEESGYDSSPQHFNLTQTTGAILSNSTTPVTMTKRKSTLHDKVVNSSGNLAKNPSKRRKVVSNASDKVIDSKSATNPLIKCSRNVNCKEYFESIDAMKYHVLTYHAAGVKKSFSCHLCGRSFPRNPLLRFHVKSKHTGQVPRIPCLIQTCSMTFIQKRSMKQHVNAVHTKKIAYKCPKCPMKFYNIDNLKYHLGAKHDKGNSSFRCHVCDVRICSKSSLKVHINSVHMGIKPFKCPFPMCSQACAHKRDLKIHINVRHTKEIVYGCTQCPKKFYARKNLTNHFNNMHRK